MGIDSAIYHKHVIYESSASQPAITESDWNPLMGEYEHVRIRLCPIDSSPLTEINDLIIHSFNLEGNELQRW